MATDPTTTRAERVAQRQENVALSWKYKQEDLSIKEIAAKLGRSPKTIRSYFYDPTATKAAAGKEQYRGTCENCGKPTSGGGGPSQARRLCQQCAGLAHRKWTKESALDALVAWHANTGALPSSYDLNLTMSTRRLSSARHTLETAQARATAAGGDQRPLQPSEEEQIRERVEQASKRLALLESGKYPASTTVCELFGSFAEGRERAAAKLG